jgi:hypothetical protein
MAKKRKKGDDKMKIYQFRVSIIGIPKLYRTIEKWQLSSGSIG